jgi:hypothetical protein
VDRPFSCRGVDGRRDRWLIFLSFDESSVDEARSISNKLQRPDLVRIVMLVSDLTAWMRKCSFAPPATPAGGNRNAYAYDFSPLPVASLGTVGAPSSISPATAPGVGCSTTE